MSYLIVGLGNIGSEYDNTRHNIGFDVMDAMAKKHGVSFELKRLAYQTSFRYKSRKFTLIKPTTYMNLSGKSVRYWMQMQKVDQKNVLVVVDDKDLDLGKLRVKGKGSAGGHNGLKNIEQILGNNQYARLRFGIGNNFPKGKQIQFVLGRWTEDEAAALPLAIDKSIEIVESFAAIGLERTMNFFN